MYPFSHVYMLNQLVKHKTALNRELNEGDAHQILGVMLLDIIINGKIRAEHEKAQEHYHNKVYSSTTRMSAGTLIHVLSDNLANCGKLEYDYSKNGFLGVREEDIKIPYFFATAKPDKIKRRVLQSGLDFLVCQKALDDLKKFFGYALPLLRDAETVDRIKSVFSDSEYMLDCDYGINRFLGRYGTDIDNMMTLESRSSAAESAAGTEYCKRVPITKLVNDNLRALNGWEDDFEKACEKIRAAYPLILNSFK